ncbi:hypothetical protein FAB82_11205 [Glycomyces buryatensis]|uniref:Sugar phosphate isomerase/epimerase n=2 Tax=Glycomyces buryatensis TaxID=2570927 RepID=A0A4V4HSF5_9ACTN|nr:hypothetical protein FAB82_11205 [Glycomyces buryatensis]
MGLSSATVPALSADELARVCTAAGGSADLRIGRGHRWEHGDYAHLFDALSVEFVGLSVNLGESLQADAVPEPIASLIRRHRIPVRCFLSRNIDQQPVLNEARRGRDRLRALLGDVDILVEVHKPLPKLADAVAAIRVLECEAVIDNRGVYVAAGADESAAVDFAREFGRAIQVKGFSTDDAEGRHIPLSSCMETLRFTEALLDAAPVAPVTIETKHSDWQADVRTVHTLCSATQNGRGTE